MESSKMDEFVANAALLAAHLKEQCEKAATSQQSSAHDLQGAAIVVRKTIEEGKRELVDHTRAAVASTLSETVSAPTKDIMDAASRLKLVVDHLHREQAALSQRTRSLGTRALGVVLLACGLVVAGTGYVAWHNVRSAERASVDAEVLAALNQVTITACDGKPCIKLEEGLRRWNKNDEYVLVDASEAVRDRPKAGNQ